MKVRRILRWAGFSVMFTVSAAAAPQGDRLFGDPETLGDGTVRTYVDIDEGNSPVAIGVNFTSGMLENLPTEPNNKSRCFDLDGDGVIADQGECEGDEERILYLPKQIADDARIPIKYIAVNWIAHGHPSPAPPPWAVPHFDFHFYMSDLETVSSIRTGPCGLLINCEDFELASKPVPSIYVHSDQIDVGAAVPAMGNHLINSQSPELVDPSQKFTHTWIIGAYDGHVTFFEPMITYEFLNSRPNVCVPINQPQAWEVAGYYPTEYCIRYREAEDAYTVSLERLVFRESVPLAN